MVRRVPHRSSIPPDTPDTEIRVLVVSGGAALFAIDEQGQIAIDKQPPVGEVLALMIGFQQATEMDAARRRLAYIARSIISGVAIWLANVEQRRDRPPRIADTPGRLLAQQPDRALAPPARPAALREGRQAGGLAA